HRRSDFMAHAREKLALGTAPALRRLLGVRGLVDGHLRFAVRVAQVLGPLGHLLFEKFAIFLEARIAMAYLPEHLVEAIDEGADLILRVALDPQGVVLLD